MNMNIITNINEWTDLERKKSQSPNSVYFYLKKGMTFDEANSVLMEHRKKLPFQKGHKKNSPLRVDYWLNKGYSIEDANANILQFQSKPLNLKYYIDKYGPEIGIKKYESRKKSMDSRQSVELENIQKQYNCDIVDAYKIYMSKRIYASPRRKEYWISKGYDECDSEKMVIKWQSEISPRTKFYWISKGYNESDAERKLSEYQKNNSLDSIMKRYNCNKEYAIQLQDMIIHRSFDENMLSGKFSDKIQSFYFLAYKQTVLEETKKTYRLYKNELDPMGQRSKEFHLDHKYSIKNGFINGVPAKIIASKFNLEVIPENENIRKQDKSSITLQELYKLYESKN